MVPWRTSRAWAVVVSISLGACGSRPTCPAGDLECLAASFSINDFETYDDTSKCDKLTMLSSRERTRCRRKEFLVTTGRSPLSFRKSMPSFLTWTSALSTATLMLALFGCGKTPSGGVREPDREPLTDHATTGATTGANKDKEVGHLRLIVTLDSRGATLDKIIEVATPLRTSRMADKRRGIRYDAFAEGKVVATDVLIDPRHKHVETADTHGHLDGEGAELAKGVIMISVPLGTETVDLVKYAPGSGATKPEDRIATLKLDKAVQK